MRRATHSWALSPRRAEVLELLVTGASNRTIADSLKCAESTVEMHVTTLLKKSSTSHALNWWHGSGWILARKLMRVLPCGSVESSPFNLKRPRPDLGPDPDNWNLCSWRCHHSRFVSAVCSRSMLSGRVRVPDIMTSESLTALVGCGETTTSGHPTVTLAPPESRLEIVSIPRLV